MQGQPQGHQTAVRAK